MPKSVSKPETGKGDLPSASTEEFFATTEGADLYLPFPTEVSPVSPESRVVVYTDPRSAGADRFRLVQIRLTGMQATKKLRCLLITSPLPGDGKSTVALNLATSLSEEGKRPVLLLEADVYRGDLVKRLGLKPWSGLTECFRSGSDPMQAIRRIEPLGFYLLPAGKPMDDGSSLLQSEFTAQLFKGLSSSLFRWILIDSPPSTPIADIISLNGQADATLLVARAGVTPRDALEETARHLGREHILGIILNGVEGLHRTYYKYYGYAKSAARAKPAKPKVVEDLGLNKSGS